MVSAKRTSFRVQVGHSRKMEKEKTVTSTPGNVSTSKLHSYKNLPLG